MLLVWEKFFFADKPVTLAHLISRVVAIWCCAV